MLRTCQKLRFTYKGVRVEIQRESSDGLFFVYSQHMGNFENVYVDGIPFFDLKTALESVQYSIDNFHHFPSYFPESEISVHDAMTRYMVGPHKPIYMGYGDYVERFCHLCSDTHVR